MYYDCIKGSDNNGTIFAIGLLAGAACSLLLSLNIVAESVARMPLPVILLLSLVLASMTGIMGWAGSNEWALGVSFAAFFMAWSFANTLFYGETRRAVDSGVIQTRIPEKEGSPLATGVVSTVFIVNSAAGTLVNGLLAFVLFTWLELSTEAVFRVLAGVQGVMTFVIMFLTMSTSAYSWAPHAEARGFMSQEPHAAQ